MKISPCKDCQHYKRFNTGAISCYAANNIDFYWPSDIDKMLKQCPLGWRARKTGENDFDFYRDYKNVHKYQ